MRLPLASESVSEDRRFDSPLFAPLRPWLQQLPDAPDSATLLALAERTPRFTAGGQRIRFVAPPAQALPYERCIWESGAVATRPDNWHDFFNALVWFAFPHTKRVLNACHLQAMATQPAGRGTWRDALTHFDECGMVVLSRQPELLALLRDFQWTTLFVERRAEVRAAMQFIVFGHATYEQLLQPFRGLTAKAVLYEVAAADWGLAPAALLAAVDARLAADLGSGRYTRPGDFQPLPVLGIPGVTPASESPAYYADTWQFRPGRRRDPSQAA